MKWRTKRWPYTDCRRIVCGFLWKPRKIGREWRWLEPALLMQRWDGKWIDIGWIKKPISEREWAQVSRGEWRTFTPWEVILHRRAQYVITSSIWDFVESEPDSPERVREIQKLLDARLPFGKWLKRYHKGRL